MASTPENAGAVNIRRMVASVYLNTVRQGPKLPRATGGDGEGVHVDGILFDNAIRLEDYDEVPVEELQVDPVDPPHHVRLRAYSLGGVCHRLVGLVALDDRSPARLRRGARVLFKVYALATGGERELLWVSEPISARQVVDTCDIDVLGVDEIGLSVECWGDTGLSHAVWLEPVVQATLGRIIDAQDTGAVTDSPCPAAASRAASQRTVDLFSRSFERSIESSFAAEQAGGNAAASSSSPSSAENADFLASSSSSSLAASLLNSLRGNTASARKRRAAAGSPAAVRIPGLRLDLSVGTAGAEGFLDSPRGATPKKRSLGNGSEDKDEDEDDEDDDDDDEIGDEQVEAVRSFAEKVIDGGGGLGDGEDIVETLSHALPDDETRLSLGGVAAATLFVANEVCKSARRSNSINNSLNNSLNNSGIANQQQTQQQQQQQQQPIGSPAARIEQRPIKPSKDDKPLPVSKRPKTPEGPEVVEVSITEVKREDLETLDPEGEQVGKAIALLTREDGEEPPKWEDLFHAVLDLRRALATDGPVLIGMLSGRLDVLAAVTSRKGVNNLRSTVSRNAVQLLGELARHSSEREQVDGATRSVLGPLSAPCVAALCQRSQGCSRFIAAEVSGGLDELCSGVGSDGAVLSTLLDAAGHKHPAVRSAAARGLSMVVQGCVTRGEGPTGDIGIDHPSPAKTMRKEDANPGSTPVKGSPAGKSSGQDAAWARAVGAAVSLARDRLPATRESAKGIIKGVEEWMGKGSVMGLAERLPPADKREIEKILA